MCFFFFRLFRRVGGCFFFLVNGEFGFVLVGDGVFVFGFSFFLGFSFWGEFIDFFLGGYFCFDGFFGRFF